MSNNQAFVVFRITGEYSLYERKTIAVFVGENAEVKAQRYVSLKQRLASEEVGKLEAARKMIRAWEEDNPAPVFQCEEEGCEYHYSCGNALHNNSRSERRPWETRRSEEEQRIFNIIGVDPNPSMIPTYWIDKVSLNPED